MVSRKSLSIADKVMTVLTEHWKEGGEVECVDALISLLAFTAVNSSNLNAASQYTIEKFKAECDSWLAVNDKMKRNAN